MRNTLPHPLISVSYVSTSFFPFFHHFVKSRGNVGPGCGASLEGGLIGEFMNYCTKGCEIFKVCPEKITAFLRERERERERERVFHTIFHLNLKHCSCGQVAAASACHCVLWQVLSPSHTTCFILTHISGHRSDILLTQPWFTYESYTAFWKYGCYGCVIDWMLVLNALLITQYIVHFFEQYILRCMGFTAWLQQHQPIRKLQYISSPGVKRESSSCICGVAINSVWPNHIIIHSLTVHCL